MKTKIIRKILAAMVAAATIASTAGVASAMEENDTYVVDETDMYEVEMDEVEMDETDGTMAQINEFMALIANGEVEDKEDNAGDAADFIYDLVSGHSVQENSLIGGVLDLSRVCSRVHGGRANKVIAKSVGLLLADSNLHNDLQNKVSTILEILTECAEVSNARGEVANCLNMLDHKGSIIADDDLATAQNIRNILNNNNNG